MIKKTKINGGIAAAGSIKKVAFSCFADKKLIYIKTGSLSICLDKAALADFLDIAGGKKEE